jgi:hypothetical protein
MVGCTSQKVEVRVKNHLDQEWQSWFAGFELKLQVDPQDRHASTLIAGVVEDQSALQGLMAKIANLNLTIESMRGLPIEEE